MCCQPAISKKKKKKTQSRFWVYPGGCYLVQVLGLVPTVSREFDPTIVQCPGWRNWGPTFIVTSTRLIELVVVIGGHFLIEHIKSGVAANHGP